MILSASTWLDRSPLIFRKYQPFRDCPSKKKVNCEFVELSFRRVNDRYWTSIHRCKLCNGVSVATYTNTGASYDYDVIIGELEGIVLSTVTWKDTLDMPQGYKYIFGIEHAQAE